MMRKSYRSQNLGQRRQEPESFGKKKFKHGYSDSSNSMQSNVVFPSWYQGATGLVQGSTYTESTESVLLSAAWILSIKGVLFRMWELHALEKRVSLY